MGKNEPDEEDHRENVPYRGNSIGQGLKGERITEDQCGSGHSTE